MPCLIHGEGSKLLLVVKTGQNTDSRAKSPTAIQMAVRLLMDSKWTEFYFSSMLSINLAEPKNTATAIKTSSVPSVGVCSVAASTTST